MMYTVNTPNTFPQMPAWAKPRHFETLEDVAFLSGAARSLLHHVLVQEDVPQPLLRARLALRAAEACASFAGRTERAGELRDTLAFLQLGDGPGPAGALYLSWLRAMERPVSAKTLHRALPQSSAEQITVLWNMRRGPPISCAAKILHAALKERPRDPTYAFILADAALAKALGWEHILPLLTLGLRSADLRKAGDALQGACHRAITTAATDAVGKAARLTRRAMHLRAVAPKLRAKGAEEAVALFLKEDAVAPTALTSLGSDRAARRFCDRLVGLGAARELTGRDTFRLYGV